ncbi:expressed unknown protein [Ectocarpus siliculosus]|uniref:Uncharacterized protein n=1 Tax=Ectocarpus siliculosus TaxID=2880 RepID=D7FXD2_ECTSI|nr:expressed unknown protein [Ectocarpus siliculosus]|eukprot:CBJ32269.1 expressed unknown protein [Ectocarpus siliculosus]
MAPYAYAFVGDEKKAFSGGRAPTPDNNAFLAAVRFLWPGARDANSHFPADFITATTTARVSIHQDARMACAHIIEGMLDLEQEEHHPETITDLWRGVRNRITTIEAESTAMEGLWHRVFTRFIKGHQGNTRKEWSLARLVREPRALADFVAEVITMYNRVEQDASHRRV